MRLSLGLTRIGARLVSKTKTLRSLVRIGARVALKRSARCERPEPHMSVDTWDTYTCTHTWLVGGADSVMTSGQGVVMREEKCHKRRPQAWRQELATQISAAKSHRTSELRFEIQVDAELLPRVDAARDVESEQSVEERHARTDAAHRPANLTHLRAIARPNRGRRTPSAACRRRSIRARRASARTRCRSAPCRDSARARSATRRGTSDAAAAVRRPSCRRRASATPASAAEPVRRGQVERGATVQRIARPRALEPEIGEHAECRRDRGRSRDRRRARRSPRIRRAARRGSPGNRRRSPRSSCSPPRCAPARRTRATRSARSAAERRRRVSA